MENPPITGTPGIDGAVFGVNARMDRLPATRSIWMLVFMLSIGGWFEFYDLFFTAYVGPGLVKSGIYSTTTASFFGFSGLGGFAAASFAGLFLGPLCFRGVGGGFVPRVFPRPLLLRGAGRPAGPPHGVHRLAALVLRRHAHHGVPAH